MQIFLHFSSDNDFFLASAHTPYFPLLSSCLIFLVFLVLLICCSSSPSSSASSTRLMNLFLFLLCWQMFTASTSILNSKFTGEKKKDFQHLTGVWLHGEDFSLFEFVSFLYVYRIFCFLNLIFFQALPRPYTQMFVYWFVLSVAHYLLFRKMRFSSNWAQKGNR